jgi:hypothetical protein
MIDAKGLLEGVFERGGEIRREAESKLTLKQRIELTKKLKQWCDRDYLNGFYEELGIDLGSLQGQNPEDMILPLIRQCENQNLIPKLLALAEECFPDEEWTM